MSYNGLNESVIFLIGLVIAFLGFRTLKKSTPRQTIARVLAKSKYKAYTCWITQQSILETGNFSSKIFNDFNNGFGMGVPRIRKSLRIGNFLASNGENFSTYKNFEDSVADYLLYAEYFNMPTNFNRPEQFTQFLVSKGYATDPDYGSKVLSLIKKNC